VADGLEGLWSIKTTEMGEGIDVGVGQ